MKLTLPQRDIYFEQLLYPEDPLYNIGAKLEIKGTLNIDTLKKAYAITIDQHDAYRSKLTATPDQVKVEFLKHHDSEIKFLDVSHYENPVEKVDTLIQEEFTKPFDLLNDFLLRGTLIKVEADLYYILVVHHHIITDGWGTSLTFQRLVKNYNEIMESGKVMTEYPYSYIDFVKDDEAYQNSEAFSKDKTYWTRKFETLPENLFEKIDENVTTNKSSRKTLSIKRSLYNRLNQHAASYNASTFHLILAILYLYFGRKHENDDFAIGLPILNRSKAAYKKTVGLFMGISLLRIRLNFEESFTALVQQVKNQLRQDYRHQRFPLGELIKTLRTFNEKDRLFNIMLSYEKQNYADNFMHTRTRVVPLTHQSERVALAVYIREFDESEDVKIDFDYNLNYFDESAIEQVAHHFENLLQEVLKHPGKKLKSLNYLTEEEKTTLLKKFNSAEVAYPKNETFLTRFKEQVTKKPENVALKDDYTTYTYKALDELSDNIAAYLIEIYGAHEKSPVGLLLERSAHMIAVLLGILKTGRAYIPLDPNFPKDRLNHIIGSSEIRMLIHEENHDALDTEAISTVSLKAILERSMEYTNTGLPVKVTAAETAYIIYTSGSTGKPKGVEIGHRSLLNLLLSIQQRPGINTGDVVFSVTTYSFDVSVVEFFLPLICGATVYIASQKLLSDPESVIKKLKEIRPTLTLATPSFYQMLFNAGWKGDKALKILCTGDLLSKSLAEKLLKNSRESWNLYGPTETTVWASLKQLKTPEDASNIGTPVNNTRLYIVDKFMNLMPVGAAGALYVGGDCLAKGYYKNEKLTQEKFISSPFNEQQRIYETGDVAKWNTAGEVIFLGRNDNQVKIRGYRIELGDIESKINDIPEVKDTVVVAKKTGNQEAFLVAFIIKADKHWDEKKITGILRKKLPEYMIPHILIPLEKFPLSPNKKVDRKALTEREVVKNISREAFKTPKTALEITLSEYWKEVLRIDTGISTTDNFFALGGHSLNAVKLMSLINDAFSYNITLKTIFDYPTIEELSKHLQELEPDKTRKIQAAPKKEYYTLTSSQYAMWLTVQQENTSIAYNMPAAYHVTGNIDVERVKDSVNKIIEKHEILRTNFVEVNGIPYQKINSFEAVNFEVETAQVAATEIDNAISGFINKPFNLAEDILIRIKVLQIDPDNCILIFCTHHAIMDGWSLEIFTGEFIGNYNAAINNVREEDSLPLQFKDYSEWLNSYEDETTGKNNLFWDNYLRDYQPKELFRSDTGITLNTQNSGEEYAFEIPEDITLKLKNLAKQEKITVYTILAAALNALLYKLYGYNDICIGTVNSGRDMPELNTQIGMFVKTLILRTKIDPGQTFVALLKNVQEDLLTIDTHQNMPRQNIHQNMLNVLLAYQNPEFSYENIEIENLKLKPYPAVLKHSRVPILFNIAEYEGKLKLTVTYDSGMYEQETIRIITLKYRQVLEEIVKDPLVKIDTVNVLLEFENVKTMDFDFDF